MASIPLFTGTVGSSIAPDSDAITKLDPMAFARGAEAAKNIPTTAGAIADAVTSGIDTYQKTRSNQNTIERQDLALERERAAQPAQLEADQLKLQKEREVYAEEVKLRQEKDQLLDILKTGDGEQTAAALTSGKFAGVFAADPHLEAYTTRIASPYLSEDYLSSFVKGKDNDDYSKFLRDNALKVNEAYNQSSAEFATNSDIGRILNNNPQYQNPTTFLDVKRFEFVPSGKFQTDARTGAIKLDPSGKQRIVDTTSYDPLAKVNSYDVVDNRSGKIIETGVSPETKDLRDKTAANWQRQKIATGTVANARDVAHAALQGRERDSGYVPGASPPTDAVIQTKSAAPLQGKPVSEFKKEVEKVPLVSESGKREMTPEATSVFGNSLGLSPTVVEKNFSALKDIISKDIGSRVAVEQREQAARSRQEAIENQEAKQKRDKELADTAIAREQLLRKAIGDEFDANKNDLEKKGFNQEAVDRHNKSVEEYYKFQVPNKRVSTTRDATFGDHIFGPRTYTITESSIQANQVPLMDSYDPKNPSSFPSTTPISSPKELYIQTHLPTVMRKYAAQTDAVLNATATQQTKKLNAGKTADAIAANISMYK